MKYPSIAQLVLLFFLGGVFLHFLLAGGRTFVRSGMNDDRAGWYAEGMFVFGGTLPVWFLGLYQPVYLLNGVIAACMWFASITLYEWARHTIWTRKFYTVWSGFVPDEVCESGPYRYVRHPLYLSYLLAYLAAAIALAHWVTAGIFVANIVFLWFGARDDERSIAASPIGAAYSDYRERTGMFFPKFRGPANAG